jgi:hypothetical protein
MSTVQETFTNVCTAYDFRMIECIWSLGLFYQLQSSVCIRCYVLNLMLNNTSSNMLDAWTFFMALTRTIRLETRSRACKRQLRSGTPCACSRF